MNAGARQSGRLVASNLSLRALYTSFVMKSVVHAVAFEKIHTACAGFSVQ